MTFELGHHPDIDCTIVGHYDGGFALHEMLTRQRGERSGDYRNLRMGFVEFRGCKQSYLDVLNTLTGANHHWTELPQLAPICLANALVQAGLEASPASFYVSRRAELEMLVARSRVVAVTTTLYLSFLPAAKVVKLLRGFNPRAWIVVGGPLIDNLHHTLDTLDLQLALVDIGADVYILEKEGETTLAQLVRCLRDGGDPGEVPNCYVRRGAGFEFTWAEPENNPLNNNAIDWLRFAPAEPHATVQLRTARSCAFACSFCDYPVRAGQLALADIDTVERELEALHRRGVRRLVFVDDTFNVPESRFKELLRMMIRRGFDFSWYAYFRCSNARDNEIFGLMADSGCAAVFLGTESASPEVLRNMRKAATPDQYARGIERLHGHGIATFASFIVGFPGETEATLRSTIDFVNQVQPSFFRAELWYYNHRSPIYRAAARYRLTGSGYRWGHATMDWQQACDAVEHIFDAASGSVWMPMYDFDFWILPYLAEKGYSLESVADFMRSCNRLLARQLKTPGSTVLPSEAALARDLECRLAPPRSAPAGAVRA